jgi:hypothetical protein
MTEPKTQHELRDAVLKAACENHVWVNAFTLVRPTEKVYADIGRAVVEMLNVKENLLPNYYGLKHSLGPITELQKLTPVLYMSINKS